MKGNIGMIGLAVMGANLARNIESRGFKVAVYNRTKSVTDKFVADFPGNFIGAADLKSFVESLERPRKIIIMVKAGAPVDAVIDELLPLLESGDIIIDAGNTYYKETQRREKDLKAKGIYFLGVGVSGGESGALMGPSIMPGGDKSAWEKISNILEQISAKVDGEACTAYIGADGSGHFVKMVHNGIEYADMQMIAESYHLLKQLGGHQPAKLAEIFSKWNEGILSSYLIEITAKIFTKADTDTHKPLVDLILDKAGQKGTGKWTVLEALELGAPVPSITAAVDARILSSLKSERIVASKHLESKTSEDFAISNLESDVEQALYAAKILAYAQGMYLIEKAGKAYNWNLNLGEIAALWRGGCIIRASLLAEITKAYQEPNLTNLVLSKHFSESLNKSIPALRRINSYAVQAGIPLPAMSSALGYYDSYRLANLPQNLIQAQRDFFGAHTYERIDREGSFHTEWE